MQDNESDEEDDANNNKQDAYRFMHEESKKDKGTPSRKGKAKGEILSPGALDLSDNTSIDNEHEIEDKEMLGP